jgi:hypothetical protein
LKSEQVDLGEIDLEEIDLEEGDLTDLTPEGQLQREESLIEAKRRNYKPVGAFPRSSEPAAVRRSERERRPVDRYGYYQGHVAIVDEPEPQTYEEAIRSSNVSE